MLWVPDAARDAGLADRLWRLSEPLVGLGGPHDQTVWPSAAVCLVGHCMRAVSAQGVLAMLLRGACHGTAAGQRGMHSHASAPQVCACEPRSTACVSRTCMHAWAAVHPAAQRTLWLDM